MSTSVYKPIYLVGIDEMKNQVLIIIRYKKDSKPTLQWVTKTIGLDSKLQTMYVDFEVQHSNKYIGGKAGNALEFIYDRNNLSLRFWFHDLGMSCNILTDTAMPFVEIIGQM